MKYYTGLDVSMKTTSICIVSQEGRVVYESEVASQPKDIAAALKSTKLPIENVAIESGSITHWLVNELKKVGLPVISIDSRKMSKVLSININKTDKNDARLIAEALRCNFYSEVTLKSQEQIDFGILLNTRRTLINSKTAIKNTIRGLLKAFGIRLGSLTHTKFLIAVQNNIQDKSEEVKISLSELLKSYESLTNQVALIDKKLDERACENEDVKLLKTIPGIGVITAFTFITYLGNPLRFKKSKSVGAYFGLTPKQYSSGEKTQQGRVSKCGNSEVRYLLVEAATSALYRTKSFFKLKAWGLKIRKKKGHKKASTAVARKYCTLMHRMLITRKPFEYGTPEAKVKKERKTANVA